MQRLNSFKDRQTSRNPTGRTPNVNIMIPGSKQPVLGNPMLDLPRFKSRPQITDIKHFSSDKAKVYKPQSEVGGFEGAKATTQTEEDRKRDLSQLQRIRKSQNLSHNKNRSNSQNQIAKVRRSLHFRQSRDNDADQLYIQRSNTKSIKKPQSHSLPNQRTKDSPSKPSLAARYKLLNDDQDEKWTQVEKDRAVSDQQKSRKMSLNKAVTEGMTKQESSFSGQSKREGKISTEVAESQLRIKRRVDSKSKVTKKTKIPEPQKQTSSQQQQKIDMVPHFSNPQDVNKVELPYFFIIEDIHLNLYQNLKNNTGISDLCLCYINLQKVGNQRVVYGLLGDKKQVSAIRTLFLFERLIVFAIIYIEKWKAKKRKYTTFLVDLARLAYTNYSTLIELILQILQETNQLDTKVFKAKQIGKDKKFKDINRSNSRIRSILTQVFESRELPLFELFMNLMDSSTKLQSLEFISVVDKTLKWQVLAMPSFPFLPPTSKEHCLVMDLDQTLIHYNQKEAVVHQRAYVSEFLAKMSKIFQIVVFTAGTKAYADTIIDSIDPQHCISFRLYRNHITLHEGAPIKDLSKLGRDLSKMVIVDNLSSNFRVQPQNGILISSWYGEQSDDILQKLSNVLKNIQSKFGHDLRDGVKHWAHFIRQEISHNRLIYEMKQDL